MDYYIFEQESPVDKEFDNFSKEEAAIYFKWYTEYIDERIQYLQNYINLEDPAIKLDFSVDSLIPVWEWYDKKIIVEHYTKRELKRKAKEYPEWLRDEILSNDTKIGINTLAICDDLAIYFAEVVRRNNSEKIYWGYYTKPKNRNSVNEPVLLGFVKGIEMAPRQIMHVCTLSQIEMPEKNMLFDLYHIWMEDIQ